MKSINELKPFIVPDYAYESPRIFSEREAAARVLAKHGLELPDDPTIVDEVLASLRSGASQLARAGLSVLELVGLPVALVGCGGASVCCFLWLTSTSDGGGGDDGTSRLSRHRGRTKKTKTKRF